VRRVAGGWPANAVPPWRGRWLPGGRRVTVPVVRIPLWHLDAFALARPFTGNPAAVCPLDRWLPDDVLQGIAAENALSETAYLVREDGSWRIRWFTPGVEVDLCGHATLAAGWVVMHHLARGCAEVTFASQSGPLTVRRSDELLALDFPARPPERVEAPEGLAAALGVTPRETWAARDFVAVLDDEDAVRRVAPDFARIAALPWFAVAVTAPGRDADFVSRFFAPAQGVPEDPVTGSVHCTLVPLWAGRLGRQRLRAHQLSRRGGELDCTLAGDRVHLAGRVTPYLEGAIEI
jgi:PhzF family phenazine biosynthesis protein